MPQPFSVPRLGAASLIALLSVVGVVLSSAVAHAAPSPPTITKVTPLKLEIGQTLTIRGRRFVRGPKKNIVVFKRDGKPAVFARADSATTTRIRMKVPAKLLPFLRNASGTAVFRRFRLRVLARRLGKAFTPKRLSPRIGPPGSKVGAPQTPQTPQPAAVEADCDKDGVRDADDPDDDNDLTPDVQEQRYGTDRCRLDSDGDGVSDTFEIQSALDLNLRALPFPGKRPYSNPLDGSDPGFDFDQDGLTLAEEYALWLHTGGTLPLTYSDGDQDTNPNGADTPTGPTYLDMDGNGVLTDDEKDADGDGLSNWDETSGRLRIAWWATAYESEQQYVGSAGASRLAETSAVDRDSDGDGVPDGADDQDHDGWSNVDELSRSRPLGDGLRYWVHPYNPCLPDYLARVCSLHPPFNEPWAPFPLTGPAPASPLEYVP